MASERLTINSKAMILLKKKFENGDISAEDTPKSIWGSELVFMEHKLDNFRTRFNKLKKEFFIDSCKF